MGSDHEHQNYFGVSEIYFTFDSNVERTLYERKTLGKNAKIVRIHH